MNTPVSTSYLPSYNGPEGQEDMPWLFLPGPVTTAREVKLAMLADWSVRDAEFISLALRVCEELLELAVAPSTHDCIPLDVSGSGALESLLCVMAPTGRKRKTVVAGASSATHRVMSILEALRRPAVQLKPTRLKPVTANRLSKFLAKDPDVKLVVLEQLDPETGIVNPIDDLAEIAKQHGCMVMLDARAGLGALPVDMSAWQIDALAGVPWAALEGVAGLSFAVIDRNLLERHGGRCPSHTLDLAGIWNGTVQTGRFPGTLPAHVMAALSVSIRRLQLEGGQVVRLGRYQSVHAELLKGMRRLGFRPMIETPGRAQAGFVTVFDRPADANYDLIPFQQRLRQKGFVISRSEGPHTKDQFKVATMGIIDTEITSRFLAAVEQVMRDLGIRTGAPAR